MDESQKKKLIIVILCITVAAGVTYWTTFRKPYDSGSTKSTVYLQCMNKQCGKVIEMTSEEFQKKVSESDQSIGMMGMGPMALECPHCGKKTAMVAEKCKKCGEIFLMNYTFQEPFPDRCPECGYSEKKERLEKLKK